MIDSTGRLFLSMLFLGLKGRGWTWPADTSKMCRIPLLLRRTEVYRAVHMTKYRERPQDASLRDQGSIPPVKLREELGFTYGILIKTQGGRPFKSSGMQTQG